MVNPQHSGVCRLFYAPSLCREFTDSLMQLNYLAKIGHLSKYIFKSKHWLLQVQSPFRIFSTNLALFRILAHGVRRASGSSKATVVGKAKCINNMYMHIHVHVYG